MITKMQQHKQRSGILCQENRGIKVLRPIMPRKSLDKRFTDNPLDQERNKYLSRLPGEG